ncbi:hypothetical protein [Thiocystis violascens]|uniref:Uncharacterized protein n=1 Tax=Thiocystis violascens (strain ATCC 17096 / DSM 198 / 6111) TaxID=765911 RepID=I3YEI2_THIV6|nr:hypothetical protein [Thiocystis violascens]AFL75400.1 hypothetical protein Thivi_3533 [Thiocystis violascens DSM 198]
MLDLKRGDSWQVRFYAYADAAGVRHVVEAPLGAAVPSGVAVDLTGCAARLQIRARAGVLAYAASLAADLALDEAPETGFVYLAAPASRTGDVIPGRYLTDLELAFPDGAVLSSATYPVTIQPDVTYTATGEPTDLEGAGLAIPSAATLEDGRLLVTAGGAWVDRPPPAGTGDMQALIYDPAGRGTDIFRVENLDGDIDCGEF